MNTESRLPKMSEETRSEWTVETDEQGYQKIMCGDEHITEEIGHPSKTDLEPIKDAHNAALTAERQRREQAEQTANHNADIGDSIARASKQVEESLQQQLISALAVIERAKKRTVDFQVKWPELESVDLSLLQERDKELRTRLETFRKNWPKTHKAIRSDIMVAEAVEEINALAELYDEISI